MARGRRPEQDWVGCRCRLILASPAAERSTNTLASLIDRFDPGIGQARLACSDIGMCKCK
jgi:hypothetical protein